MPRQPILIVDDNPMTLKLARLILAAEGYDVRTAMEAEEAFKLLDHFRPSLILMDLHLPGIDTLRKRIKDYQLPVVALTSCAATAREAGCDGYISKPVDTRALPSQVRNYLRP